MLVAARLRHIAATKWGTKRYLTAELLADHEATTISRVITQTEACRSESAKDSGHNLDRHAVWRGDLALDEALTLHHFGLNGVPGRCY